MDSEIENLKHPSAPVLLSSPKRTKTERVLWGILLSLLVCALYAVVDPTSRSSNTTLSSSWRFFAHLCLRPTPKGPIDWKPCGDNYECGRLEVPLDYHNASAGKASLSVGRYLATSKTRLGSVFVNPGGPGGSGVSFVYRAGPQLSEIFEGAYDIVSWDPRGINGTTPRVECFADKRTQNVFSLEHDDEIEFRNLSSPADADRFRTQLELSYARDLTVAQLCAERTGEALKHVGTATVVRDLEYFASVLEGKDTPINFAGFSYGTVVGAWLVNMFPNRVGRVLIDGVVDPITWATVPEYKFGPNFVSTEAAFENFVSSCIGAGPERCALANNSTTAPQLNKKIRKLLDDLYDRPLPVPHATRPGVLRAGHVRSSIFSALYRPREWPSLAAELSAIFEKKDGAPLLNSLQGSLNLSDTTSLQSTSMSTAAVICTDGPDFSDTFSAEEAVEEVLRGAVETYEKTSRMFAGLASSTACFGWKARESERFAGPFNSSLANTILVIGNTADPITPLPNAKVVNGLLKDSRLVIQDGAGHCSLAQVSLCTGKVLREYFLEGKLPENGKVCPTTEILFPPPKSPSVTGGDETPSSLWATESLGEGEEFAPEDLKLMNAMKAFGEAVHEGVPIFGRQRYL